MGLCRHLSKSRSVKPQIVFAFVRAREQACLFAYEFSIVLENLLEEDLYICFRACEIAYMVACIVACVIYSGLTL
jgi:hypothetical protein